jgi:TolA-binding protein
MIAKLKFAAYVALIALAVWLGRQLYSNYSVIGRPATAPSTNPAPDLAANPDSNTTPDSAVHPMPGLTNPAVPQPAPVTVPNPDSSSNLGITTVSNPGPASGQTNPTGNDLAAPPASPAGSNPAGGGTDLPVTAGPVPAANNPQGRAVGYLAAFVGALVGLGLLAAYDMTHFMGSRAVDYLFSDVGEGMRDPEYERAEQTWVNGKPLEAIQMMREYLEKNPREQYVALRIAEIYEKDLRNFVAASLEYEEVLKKRLPPERWGWAAIHLCNLYARMGQQDKMTALLQRIVRDYPGTGAAKKARQTLGLPERQEKEEEAAAPAATPERTLEGDNYAMGQVFDLDEMITAADEEAQQHPPPAAAKDTPLPERPAKSNLPPGFRKKE